MTAMIEQQELAVSLNEEGSNAVRKVVADLYAYSKSLIVEDESDYLKMTAIYRQAKDWRKIVEARRKELTEPLRTEVARINDRAKEITEPLDEIATLANSKTASYMQLLEKAKEEKETRLNAIGSLWGCDESVEIEPVKNVIRGDGAMMIKKSEKRFRLLDITKVPTKYLMVDEEAIKKDLKLGIEVIPGIEVYNETTTQLRVR